MTDSASKQLNRQIGRSGLGMLAANLAAYALRFVKIKVIAMFFGTSAVLGAYYAALNIPLTVTGLLTTGITAALVPLLIEIRTKRGEDDARALWSRFGAVILGGMVIGCLLTAVFAWPIVGVLIDPTIHDHALAAHLLRLLLIYLAMWITVQFLIGIFQSHRRVVFPMLMGLPNLVINIVIVWALLKGPWRDLPKEEQIYALVWGLLLGGLFTFVALLVEGWRTHILRPSWAPSPELRRSLSNGAGLLLATLVSPAILLTIDTIMAAPINAIATITYAYQLFMVPVTIGVLSLGQLLLPYLSGQVAERDWEGMSRTVSLTLRVLVFTMAPMSVGLCLVSQDVVRIFEGGEFTPDDTLQVSAALYAFGWGLLFAGVGSVAMRLLTAMQRVKALLWLSAVAFAVKLGVNIALRDGMGATGIAWGTSAYHIVAVLLLGWWCLRTMPIRMDRGVGVAVLKSIGGCVVMGLAVWGVMRWMDGRDINLLTRLVVEIGTGSAVWIAWAWATRMDEMGMMLRLVRRRQNSSK